MRRDFLFYQTSYNQQATEQRCDGSYYRTSSMPVIKNVHLPHASGDSKIPACGLHFPSPLDKGLPSHRCVAAYLSLYYLNFTIGLSFFKFCM